MGSSTQRGCKMGSSCISSNLEGGGSLDSRTMAFLPRHVISVAFLQRSVGVRTGAARTTAAGSTTGGTNGF
jgi:hypothetical protein